MTPRTTGNVKVGDKPNISDERPFLSGVLKPDGTVGYLSIDSDGKLIVVSGGGGGGGTVQIEGADGTTIAVVEQASNAQPSDNALVVSDPVVATLISSGLEIAQIDDGASNDIGSNNDGDWDPTATSVASIIAILKAITLRVRGRAHDGSSVGTPIGSTTTANSMPVALPSDQVAIPAKITNGTNIADVFAGDSGSNGFTAGNGTKTVTFSTSSSTAIASTNVSNWSYVSVYFASGGTGGAFAFQGSNDNTNWVALALADTSAAPVPVSSRTSAQANGAAFQGAVPYMFFRINLTGLSGGTASGTVVFKSIPFTQSYGGVNAAQSGAWTVNLGQAAAALVDTLTNPTATQVGAANELFNETSWDKQRMNTTKALIAAGTTSTQTNIPFTTYNARGLVLQVQIASGAGTVAVAINGVTASGFTYNILTSTALVGVGGTQLRVFPGATATTNLVANDVLPRSIQVTATVVGTISYGIDYVLTV